MPSATERLSTAVSDCYRIGRHLGEGGMATVYLAHDLKHDRSVALKVLRPELAAVIGAERFLAEIRTTANLQHPNILPLFDSGDWAVTPDSRTFLMLRPVASGQGVAVTAGRTILVRNWLPELKAKPKQ
jgi:serine/threonine protein kinase